MKFQIDVSKEHTPWEEYDIDILAEYLIHIPLDIDGTYFRIRSVEFDDDPIGG